MLCYSPRDRVRRNGARALEPEPLAHRVIDLLSELQAEDIALLDIGKASSFADYFVLATAHSPLQFGAIVERLGHELKEAGVPPRHQEGRKESGWVFIDFGDVIVHVFSPEKREYYRLEELWGRTTPVVRFTG